jgi:hypothetical protein
MLNYVVNSWVAKSYSEKSINRILDYISSTSNVEFLEQVYQQTLGSLEKAKNEVSSPSQNNMTTCDPTYYTAIIDKNKFKVGEITVGSEGLPGIV